MEPHTNGFGHIDDGTLKMSDKEELLNSKSGTYRFGRLLNNDHTTMYNSCCLVLSRSDKSPNPGIDNPAFESDNMNGGGLGNGFHLNHSNGVAHEKQKEGADFKTTEQMAEAVNLELLNLGSNGLNGIPVKSPNSTVINMSNPYDEYFIPVNEHRKYIR